MLAAYFRDCLREVTSGSRDYWLWLAGLAVLIVLGGLAYAGQARQGLIVTGMSDQVAWGVYISNFTFLVGLAAAAVMVVVPAYIFQVPAAKHVVLLAEGVAVAACIMCILFVTVDLGRPDRLWHLIPGIGRLHWPTSMLAWDIVVLGGYLALNLFIPMYVLYRHYIGREPELRKYFPWVLLAIFWAISIHTVTAFLYSWNPARPFWHTSLLAPRFIASAFTAGPAFIILAFQVIDRRTEFHIEPEAIHLLALIAAVALQINMFMLGAEIFTEFYRPTHHSLSAEYLFRGLHGRHALVPWIYSAITMELAAMMILMIHRLRTTIRWLNLACVLAIVGIWIEKGMGLIVPGFIPTTLGEVFEYRPTVTEVLVSVGIWAVGLFVFTLLAKAAVGIELHRVRLPERLPSPVEGMN